MIQFIDKDTQYTLITAPEKVRAAYVKTGDWIGWWVAFGNPFPQLESIDAFFWRTFDRLGGSDGDFQWMVDAGLCEASDRQTLELARAEA